MLRSRLSIAIIAVLVLIAIVARVIPGARTIDDAFITFRYARNIDEGLGFVYNPGVHTLGTTTPLFTLALAGVGLLTGSESYPQVAIIFSAIADAITVGLLYGIARRVMVARGSNAADNAGVFPTTGQELIAALPGLLWAISPMSVTFAVGGMETSVNILWMVAAVYVFTGERTRRSDILLGVFAALGLLTRVDAALWIAPLFGWQLIERLTQRRKDAKTEIEPQRHEERKEGQEKRTPYELRAASTQRIPVWTWVACALVLLPWVVYATAAFGNPIPNSVTAKRFAYVIPDGAALVRMIQTYATPFFEFDTFGSIGAMVGSLVYLLLSLLALSHVARRLPRLLPFLLYPWLYLLVFSVLNPLIFRWYMAPPLPALMLGIVIGAWALFGIIKQPTVRTALVGIAGAVWIFTSVNGWTLTPDHGPAQPAPKMAWHALELEYQAMGEYLRDEIGVTPQTRVASGDIGAIGYFSRATIIDTVGLVTPELTRYYPVDPAAIAPDQNYAIPPALIYDTQPEYLVTMEGFIRVGLAQQERFQSEYELIRDIPFPFYGTSMQLFQRVAN